MHIGIDGWILDDTIKAGTYHDFITLIDKVLPLDHSNKYTVYLRGAYTTKLNTHASNITFKRLTNWNKRTLVTRLHSLLALQNELIINPPDVYFSPIPELPLYCPCKKVIQVYDLAYLLDDNYFTFTQRMHFKLLAASIMKRADRIIAISNSTKYDIVRHLKISPDKITVIYRTHDTMLYKPCLTADNESYIRQKYGIQNNYILTISTLEPRKNISRLIEAYASLKRDGSFKYDMVIVGPKGWLYQDIFDTVTKLGIEKDVIFTGYVPETDLPLLIKAACVFAYVSLYEGFGLPLLHAMACGTPVITSNTSSMPEVVGDSGWLVNPYSSKDIADALSIVLADDTVKQEMSAKGLRRAALFSPQSVAKQMNLLFREVFDN